MKIYKNLRNIEDEYKNVSKDIKIFKLNWYNF